MRLLPAEQRTFAYKDGAVIAGLHERNGYRHYSLFLDRQLLAGCDHFKLAIHACFVKYIIARASA
jgi:hypothetical protein